MTWTKSDWIEAFQEAAHKILNQGMSSENLVVSVDRFEKMLQVAETLDPDVDVYTVYVKSYDLD